MRRRGRMTHVRRSPRSWRHATLFWGSLCDGAVPVTGLRLAAARSQAEVTDVRAPARADSALCAGLVAAPRSPPQIRPAQPLLSSAGCSGLRRASAWDSACASLSARADTSVRGNQRSNVCESPRSLPSSGVHTRRSMQVGLSGPPQHGRGGGASAPLGATHLLKEGGRVVLRHALGQGLEVMQ